MSKSQSSDKPQPVSKSRSAVNPKPKPKSRTAAISMPKLTLEVSLETMREASQCVSSRCAIAETIKQSYGKASRPEVDADWIRFTDTDGRRRYYRTPRNAQAFLINYDAGILPDESLRIVSSQGVIREPKDPSVATLNDVRGWARGRPELSYAGRGDVPQAVVGAYLAEHPGKTTVCAPGGTRITQHNDCSPTVHLSPSAPSPVSRGYAARKQKGGPKNPNSRRRVFGSKDLTRKLEDTGWVTPEQLLALRPELKAELEEALGRKI